MPLFYQQDINETTRLAIWKIDEEEDFFLRSVPLQRSITHPHKRLQHLAGRYLLPFLFPDFPNEAIEIADTRKPFLPDEQYHFSISHCGDFAAAIVSTDHRVGIDIETITARVVRIQHKFLHQEELSFVQQHEEAQLIPLLTLLWSTKEAMFKWWGSGDVDFSEVLRFEPFVFAEQGMIPARFVKTNIEIPLDIHYMMYETIDLAWVISKE